MTILERRHLLSVPVNIGSFEQFVENILELSRSRTSSVVCVANVHMLIEAINDKIFFSVMNEADIVTPDGMPLVKSIQSLYKISQDRVAGMDLLPTLLHATEKQNLNVFFYGGTTEMQNRTSSFVLDKFPDLNVTGFHSPPFRPLTTDEEEKIIEKINSTGTHLLFVALGCPKQEKWMASMKGRINACMIGIGGALPVMIGMQDRAPAWMQKNSLEWLYRLYQEPGRLWKRYFYTNSLFIWLFSLQYLKYKFLRR